MCLFAFDDWANREDTRRSWDLVARYVVPEVNGMLDGFRESNSYVKANRDTWNRAGAAIMSKIAENDRAAAAMAAGAGEGPGAALVAHSAKDTAEAARNEGGEAAAD